MMKVQKGNATFYYGQVPIKIVIGGEHYSVRGFVPKHKAWRCLKVSWSERFSKWFVCDDDYYIISNDGKIICRETGWEFREVYEDLEGNKYGI